MKNESKIRFTFSRRLSAPKKPRRVREPNSRGLVSKVYGNIYCDSQSAHGKWFSLYA